MGPSLCTLCTAQKPQGLAGNNEESANPCVGGGGKEVEERSWEDRSPRSYEVGKIGNPAT